MNNVPRNVAGLNEPRDYSDYFKPGFVHRSLYTDEAIFAEEMRVLYGATWIYIGHDSEIPNVNDFVTRRLGRRPVILTRTANGDPAVLMNRCTHRGATICRQERGNAKTFVCGYHGWAFGSDGACVGVPQPDAYSNFKKSDQDLGRATRVESYRGFIFATLNSNIQPLVDHLAVGAQYIDDWLDRYEGKEVKLSSAYPQFDCHANWKIIYDNAVDGYHVPYSHRSMLKVFGERYGDVDMAYFKGNMDDSPLFSMHLGNGHTVVDQRPMMHAESSWERQHVSPGREVLEEKIVQKMGREESLKLLNASTGGGMNISIFPNLMFVGNQVTVVEPVSPNRSYIHWYATTIEESHPEINAIRLRMQEDFTSLGEVDDSVNFESCQLGLDTIPEMEWLDVRRHLDTDLAEKSDDGLVREKVTSEFHTRVYFQEWKRIMENGDELSIR